MHYIENSTHTLYSSAPPCLILTPGFPISFNPDPIYLCQRLGVIHSPYVLGLTTPGPPLFPVARTGMFHVVLCEESKPFRKQQIGLLLFTEQAGNVEELKPSFNDSWKLVYEFLSSLIFG